MKRTDHKRIEYPQGMSIKDRRFCRNLIVNVRDVFNKLSNTNKILVACSGGIDSTVLAHAISQGLRINPYMQNNKYVIKAKVAYVNHHIRSEGETTKEELFVKNTIGKWISSYCLLDAPIKKGSALQERARHARYAVLSRECSYWSVYNWTNCKGVVLLTAHNKNDNVETKLFNYLTGRNDKGISYFTKYEWGYIARPLLEYTRSDIERYANAFELQWCEDVSNETDDYTRNRIRHHLIPWIEQNINKGLIKTLSRNNMKQLSD